MTLKEELEILRGEPICAFEGDPMEIPCIETSNAEKLCKNPVVSVNMITYNHEPYIRQAIDGVMMQKTDFEFELVIGEDCSQDKTREICFEYQKKYPDKIRVLWWHENVSKLGGNDRRVTAHCRGEFIAYCEGDDFWVDAHKLQKQVKAMRENPSVGYCVTGAKVLSELPEEHPRMVWVKKLPREKDGTYVFPMRGYTPGLVPRSRFWQNRNTFPRTATVMLRRSYYCDVKDRFEIFKWCLKVGDLLLWYGLSQICDAYYIPDQTAVYRLCHSGVCVAEGGINRSVYIDGCIERIYFLCQANEPWCIVKMQYKQILSQRINQLLDKREWSIKGCMKLAYDWACVSRRNHMYWGLLSLIYTLRRIRSN